MEQLVIQFDLKIYLKKFPISNSISNSILIPDVIKLDWSDSNKDYIQSHLSKIDLIIGADIIYDDSLFDSLLSTIKQLFDYCDKCEKFMLMNAIRNPQTEQAFLTKLGNTYLMTLTLNMIVI